jgi:hypothetical protein
MYAVRGLVMHAAASKPTCTPLKIPWQAQCMLRGPSVNVFFIPLKQLPHAAACAPSTHSTWSTPGLLAQTHCSLACNVLPAVARQTLVALLNTAAALASISCLHYAQ